MNTLLDIHTHLIKNKETAIYNYKWNENLLDNQFNYLSAGIHPWTLTADNLNAQIEWLTAVCKQKNIIAIGEGGLDATINLPLDLQIKGFEQQINLAEQNCKPLIIHVVKKHNEIIALKKQHKPYMPWIIHGFRGKKELAEQYLRAGFYLSFGRYYNTDAFINTPLDKILLETDESEVSISELYLRAAQIRNMQIEEFEDRICENIQKCFFTTK